jgi:hypothetical protein
MQDDARSFRSASALFFRGSWSATQSGASSVGPSKTRGRQKAALSGAEGLGQRQSARRLAIGPFGARIIGYAVSEAVPWNKMVTWDRTPLGLETAAPCISRALRWLWRDRKDAGIFKSGRFRRCTGRLNATQPGVLAVSPLYIRGMGLSCK